MTSEESAVRSAHAWASEELATSDPGSVSESVLHRECCRLAGIVEMLQRGRRRYYAPSYEERRARYLAARGGV